MGRACGYEFLPGSQATPRGAVTKRLTYIFPFEDGGMCVSVLVCLFFFFKNQIKPPSCWVLPWKEHGPNKVGMNINPKLPLTVWLHEDLPVAS